MTLYLDLPAGFSKLKLKSDHATNIKGLYALLKLIIGVNAKKNI